jgi:hypothetical protein
MEVSMAKDTRKEEAEEREHEREAAKAAKDHRPGGSEGARGSVPVDINDQLTEQEKAPHDKPVPPKEPEKAVTMDLHPKEPYPTGNPPSAEDEARRARGEPREGAKKGT